MTECYYMDVSELEGKVLEVALSALPWEERRKKANTYLLERDKKLCVGTGLLLYYALTSVGAPTLDICYGKHGKPTLANDMGIHFNCSHSGELAVCAVSDAPVGVDVERISEFDEGVAKYAFTKEERQLIANDARTFFRLWTRKESYVKRNGTGFSVQPNEINVINDDILPMGCVFSELEVNGYIITLCGEKCERLRKLCVCDVLNGMQRQLP